MSSGPSKSGRNTMPALAILVGLGLGTSAFAQESGPPRAGQTAGLRYLTWAGKTNLAPSVNSGLRRPAASTPASVAPPADGRPRYPGIGAPAASANRYSGRERSNLTPATAYSPAPNRPEPTRPSPAYAAATAPQPMPTPPAPAPVYRAPVAPTPASVSAPAVRREVPVYRVPVENTAPPRQPRPVPVPDVVALRESGAPAPSSVPAGYDPMAPRRDAPIFRMQRPAPLVGPAPDDVVQQPPADAPQPAPQAASPAAPQSGPQAQVYGEPAPARETARYYSVHRETGQRPDATPLPISVYLDQAPVDLAEPPEPPVQTRIVNGRAQVIQPNQDPTLP